MTVVICTGIRGEMLFGGRRVSRDAVILADMTAGLAGRLYCTPFSEKYLAGAGLAPTVCDAPWEEAGEGDLVFLECPPIAPILPHVDRLIRYSFEETYPQDVVLDFTPAEAGFRLASQRELVGKAHKKLICEVYER